MSIEQARHIAAGKAAFIAAFDEWYSAGMKMVEAWDNGSNTPGADFNADDFAPLPPQLAPPVSFDDWFGQLYEHYHQNLHFCLDCAEPTSQNQWGDWQCTNPKCFLGAMADGKRALCPDCGKPVAYDLDGGSDTPGYMFCLDPKCNWVETPAVKE